MLMLIEIYMEILFLLYISIPCLVDLSSSTDNAYDFNQTWNKQQESDGLKRQDLDFIHTVNNRNKDDLKR